MKNEVLCKVQLRVGPHLQIDAVVTLSSPTTDPSNTMGPANRPTCTGPIGPVATPFPAPAPLNAGSLCVTQYVGQRNIPGEHKEAVYFLL